MAGTEHQCFFRGDSRFPRVARALCSTVLPGTGQLAGGATRRGLVFMAITVSLLIIAGVSVAYWGVDRILAWVVEPSVLLGLLVFNGVLFGFRLYAVIDAYLTPRVAGAPSPAVDRSSTKRVMGGVALAVLLFLTVAPHAAAGYYTYLSRDLLTTVFVSGTDRGPEGGSSMSSDAFDPTNLPVGSVTSIDIASDATLTTAPGARHRTRRRYGPVGRLPRRLRRRRQPHPSQVPRTTVSPSCL